MSVRDVSDDDLLLAVKRAAVVYDGDTLSVLTDELRRRLSERDELLRQAEKLSKPGHAMLAFARAFCADVRAQGYPNSFVCHASDDFLIFAATGDNLGRFRELMESDLIRIDPMRNVTDSASGQGS